MISAAADPNVCPPSDEVVATLGVGAFGKVVKCIDRHRLACALISTSIYWVLLHVCLPVCVCVYRDEHVAVKIVRNLECFREVARSEIVVLEEINSLDDDHTL